MKTNRTRQRRRVTYSVALAALAISLPTTAVLNSASADEAATELYMNPDGNEDASGTADDPAPTMARIAEIVNGDDSSEVTVNVDPGTYKAKEVANFSGSRHITVVAGSGDTVFDGSDLSDNGEYWIESRDSMSFSISGVTVQNFTTGGLRIDGPDGNNISDVDFTNIGNVKEPSIPGYAALHLTQTSNNTFADNTFVDLVNTKEDWGDIHAIYASDDSSDIQITGSTFDHITGDPVRLRTGTSNVKVHDGNTFRNSGYMAMVSYWVFDQDEGVECGSGNEVYNNKWNGLDREGNGADDGGPFPIMMSDADNDGHECDDALTEHDNTLIE